MRTTSHRGRRVLHVLTAEQNCFVARTGAEVRWRSERQDQLVWADIIHHWMKRGKKMGCSVTVEEDVLPPPPFYQTPLGQRPLKIREQIYEYLLATVSPLANLRLTPQIDQSEAIYATMQTISTSKFIHLDGSDLRVLRTCQQVYNEIQQVLHAQNSYFVANSNEFSNLIHSSKSCRSILCGNSITSLAVKDLSIRTRLFSDPGMR